MRRLRRRFLLGASLLPAVAFRHDARAVVILDTTWRAEGGRPGREVEGYAAHIELAHQPQFNCLVALSQDEGEEWDDASATWLGNFDGAGWLLTAGHNFKRGEAADAYLYRSQGNTIFNGENLFVHPLYNGDGNVRGGYDVALVQLDEPVLDAGPPPLLYGGRVALGTRVVMVGFGSRGTALGGEDNTFSTPEDNKAAATNTVDEITEPVLPPPDDDDAGNQLRVTLRHEWEGAGRLDGLLGGGDSGGSLWTTIGGRWMVVGVNVSGTGEIYGEHSYFACLSGIRAWMSRILPALRFVA